MSQGNVGTGTKDPDDICTFTLDWTPWLAVTEDTILDCDAIVDAALTLYDCWFTETDTTVRVGGGSDGSDYTVTYRIYTVSGDQFDRSIKIRCKSR